MILQNHKKLLRLIILNRFHDILLGDNSFYGIDHLSHGRGRERAKYFQNIENIVELIETSYDNGITGMVVANRPQLKNIVASIDHHSDIVKKLNFYAVTPYAQGIQLKLSEKGIIGMVNDLLKSGNVFYKLKIVSKGGIGFLKKDFSELFKIFLDTEISKLKVIHPKIIYLHPAFTDLILSLNLKNLFDIFQNHLRNNHGISAGLCTKNFPYLVKKLSEWNMKTDSIMTSFNKSGYLMNPSRKSCELTLNEYSGHVLAMNIMAGGYLPLNDAFDYVVSQPKIKNVVVGLSSKKHAAETFTKFKNY